MWNNPVMKGSATEEKPLPLAAVRGDTPQKNIVNPFHLHFSAGFREWLARENASIAFTTYEGAKLVIVGPGLYGGTTVTERNFERCMALAVEDHRNIWVSTHHQIWKLENGLQPGREIDGWDRVYLPRSAHVTGGVDVHDVAIGNDKTLYGVVTQYNCIARIGGTAHGSFQPVWKPPFISEIIGEDRCHLNGFCLEYGLPAYATAIGATDAQDGWRELRRDGGVIINVRDNRIIASGLAMPHTPRLYRGKLWFLEAARGWLCALDPASGKVERLLWRPGFLRGLRFHGDYALICSSKPRDKVFRDLPLEEELKRRKQPPKCAVDIVDIKRMEVAHSLDITGHVRELYDIHVLPGCRQPLLYGIEGDDIRQMVVVGKD